MRKWALVLFLLIFLTVTTCVARSSYAKAEDQAPEQADIEPAAAELPLLVNLDHPLPEGYEPEKLVDLYDHKRSFKLANTGIYMEARVFEAMNEMFKAAKGDGVTGFIVTSGFRTQKKQAKIYKSDKEGVAAKPGFSEHQTGLAFDVTAGSSGNFAKTKQFKWLREHCWAYGFILRYPKDKIDLTQIPYEPWHYRYVGVEHAMKIKAAKVCLEEYVAAGGQVEPAAEEEALIEPAA